MGKKQAIKHPFLLHEWKKGEIIYKIVYTSRFGVPVGVARLKVTGVSQHAYHISIFAEHCSKKFLRCEPKELYLVAHKSPRYHNGGISIDNYFLTKKEADNAFEARKMKFINEDRDRTYSLLVKELNELDQMKNNIFGIMRMKIMKC